MLEMHYLLEKSKMPTLLHKIIRAIKVIVFCASLITMLVLTGVSSPTALAANPGDPLRLGEDNIITDATTSLIGNSNPTLEIVNRSSNVGSPALHLDVNPKVPPIVVNDGAGKAINLDADKLDGRDSTMFADGVNGKANDADKLDSRDSTTFANGTNGKANSAFSADNADKLDGKDSLQYWSGKSYSAVTFNEGKKEAANVYSINASCDLGDTLLNVGGGITAAVDSNDAILRIAVLSSPTSGITVPQTGRIYARKSFPTQSIYAEVICADFPPLRP
jgi:hypothetical protein